MKINYRRVARLTKAISNMELYTQHKYISMNLKKSKSYKYKIKRMNNKQNLKLTVQFS